MSEAQECHSLGLDPNYWDLEHLSPLDIINIQNIFFLDRLLGLIPLITDWSKDLRKQIN